ncbi:hypothetical protein PIB30_025450 [Stylosanthes scabra]|uniref:Receptor ligand binding region domain-containing protein n=1 Tax=Stylosanthes scabra TaxID=79078 RepID=A0ABU6U8X7_9FABA|nr:hypothetical protein [Stylosanthes scabra]
MSMDKIVLGTAISNHNNKGSIIGVVADNSARSGKEEIVAIKIALEDFYDYTNRRFAFVLHIRDSHGDPLKAALSARDLIEKEHVEAIIGPQTWEETTLIAELCNQNMTPLLSLADVTPNWATSKCPFMVQTSPNPLNQMKAVSAIVQSWDWYCVNIIYQDRDASSTQSLSTLYTALTEAGITISNLLSVPPFPSSSLSKDLENLREGHCRVFVVNLSLNLAINLFETASKMDMVGKDYVWIITDPFTSLVHSLDASTVSSMQGIIGVKSYFQEIGQKHEEFYRKFRREFSLDYPQELNNEPGNFAAHAYDAAWTVALAMSQTNKNEGGQFLMNKILHSNFLGLKGRIQFNNHRLDPTNTFQIINVIGKGYKEIGFWSNGLGFSSNIGEEHEVSYSCSMKELGQGFTIDLFKATMELMPYHVPYKFYAFNDTYDELVRQIYLKNFDAVIDVTIVSYRYQYAEFTQPYTDPGVVMIVPLKSKTGHRAWLFVKPFTKTMWILIMVVIIYNAFVLWMLERNHFCELKGSILKQYGTIAWLALTPLINLNGNILNLL